MLLEGPLALLYPAAALVVGISAEMSVEVFLELFYRILRTS